MAVKLHRCKGTFIKVGHPCWKAQKALDEAGVEYEVVYHPILHPNRKELKAERGSPWLPLIEFEDGSILRESKEIVRRAQEGTLDSTPTPAA